ncbi:hypothetical protein GCM10025869_19610 [Homoserinibacter gongjuensis]|uniref:UTP--glucose-1-phosphate uridylyltransferase n=1 Tax=Homoserinibacter gongjuensis TaxID=1162968 RepID=A0ABQ6JUP7_9MICO|nr:hypothetical protein GCM10025869_19610 [Homoserinibacter gongjuensis]
MLPVVDKPAIQYVVEEAVAAGLTDVLMITGRNKTALENHFDRAGELEAVLESKGDDEKLKKVDYSTHLADVHYVRQGDPLGLGHAVLRSKMHVGHEPFAVLLGDDIIDVRDPLLGRMLEVQQRENTTVVALLEVDPSQTHLYGIATVEPTEEDDVVRITGLVEKPPPGESPSNYAIIGRYVLRPEIFEVLERTPPGRGGEIQLTDALQELAAGPNWAGVCTASCSAGGATTRVIGSTTSRRSCGWRATATTSASSSVRGSRSSSRGFRMRGPCRQARVRRRAKTAESLVATSPPAFVRLFGARAGVDPPRGWVVWRRWQHRPSATSM